MSNAVVVTLMLAAAPSAVADQSLPTSRAGTRFGVLRPAQPMDPYRMLFTPQRDLPTAEPAPNAVTPPRMVCGMKMIPGDPHIDPKFLVGPKDDGVDYKLRTIPPPICQSAR